MLAVLSIATGFLDDTTRPTRWWSEQITEDDIRIREINVTVRCILQDTNYDIHSFTAKMIADAVEEMKQVRSDSPAIHMTEWASKGSERVTRIAALSTNADEGQDDRRDSGYGGGEAVWRHGVMTPEPSPPLATAANRTFLR